jgi:CHRD domain
MHTLSSIAAAAVVVTAVGLTGGVAVAQVPQHHVTLSGAKEAPTTGDANGSGEFSWSLDGTRLCYLLTAKNIGTAAAAHIHRGAVGVAGPVRVELTAPNPASVGCRTISSALATGLRDHPRRFYVNVHTAAFPNGAIRAQL